MTRLLAGFFILMMLSGCAMKGGKPSFIFTSKWMKMRDAEQALSRGDETAAIRFMEEVAEDREIDEGVTDEALFRLSLLGIRQYRDPDGMKLLRSRLDRLNNEYPKSIWTRLSWPLAEYVSDSEKSRNDLRNVKVRNSALSRENRELNLSNQQVQTLIKENRELQQRIEKLKSLDLELERKNRR